METIIYDLKDKTIYDKGITAAAEEIRRGGIVVFPTETVYGLGADATNASAVSRIFEAKGRPQDNPLIVHIAEKEDIFLAASSLTPDAQKLADAFMPGPISIIVKKSPSLAENVTAGLETVAVRMPVCPEARDFIRAAGVPVAAPSANISGKPSPTRAEHVIKDMNGRAGVILSGYDCVVGLESTVVDASVSPASILRPGAVTPEMISGVLGYEVRQSYRETLKGAPKAPGMKYRHYKPEARVICVHGDDPELLSRFVEKTLSQAPAGSRCAAAVFDEVAVAPGTAVYRLGSMHDPEEVSRQLFSALRRCDTDGITLAVVTSLPEGGIGDAFVNRLHKASDEIVYL